MLKKKNIWNILVTLLLFALFLTNFASATTEAFEEYTKDSHFIASRGTFADTVDQEWKNTIGDCYASLPDSFSYYKFDKAISSFACSEFIIVELKSEYRGKIDDSRIDQLYQKIEVHCEKNTGLNEVPAVFMWAEDDEYLVIEYDPDAFEKAKNSSGFVASMGNVPVFTNEDEWLEWSEKVHEARIILELEPYFASGPVLSYGFKQYSGYIEVGVNKETSGKVTDSSLNEIYKIINEHFEEEDINDIPVVFMWDLPAQTEEALYVEVPPTEEESSQTTEDSLENETIENEEKPSQTTPGFTSIILTLCLVLLVKIRR
jgi:hypothetical protein